MRHIKACIASAAIAAAFALPAPAFAQDMGSNPITDFFDGLGLGAKEKPDIDYQERAPLVPPSQSGQLPPPQPKSAAREGVAWPNDPDVAARAERKARNNKVPTETYSYQMDRSPRVDPDELSSRRTAGASVSRGPADATRGDNEITRSQRGELDGKIIRGGEAPAPGSRARLTDPPGGYMVGNGVTAQAEPEKKPWYKRMLGQN
ncbi:hypothetical protein [Methylopila sp. M107]|uniref:hypothetical protein n=1 Tax=Methylopila sp. M107 TaxID=1101190 RepID=UPI000381596C|nr:hypothetical protein [Methylopila sp. M107]